ncbi:MAG: hypothetical protein E6J80_10195, partial [Deltaproteobacteria bacterium]
MDRRRCSMPALPTKSWCARPLTSATHARTISAVHYKGEKAMRRDNALIVSLDIGTYKTAVIVAEATPAEVEVIGIGTALSQGLRKSQVVNVEATVQAIRKAVDEAQMGASCEIHNVCAGLTGEHITGLLSQGVVVVKDREVSSADVARVIEVARAIALPSGYEILH